MDSRRHVPPVPGSGDPYRLLRDHTPDRAAGDVVDDRSWFAAHYETAASRALELLETAGVTIAGKEIADVGCGDGTIDLGIVHAGKPRSLTGFDLEVVDMDRLAREARASGVIDAALPAELRFERCGVVDLPAADASFDAVVCWSTFEHVRRPVEVLSEIRRVLRPGGALFLQIWPLWHSAHGSHLWPWYPQGFANLLHTEGELRETIAAQPFRAPEHASFLLEESLELNQMTIDDLQRSVLAAGLRPVLLKLDAEDVHLPVELAHHSVADLAISGVALVAVAPDA